MPPLKKRIRVVLDTNVVAGFHLSRSGRGADVTVFKHWLVSHDLQLIVSAEVVAEYLEILDRLNVPKRRIGNLRRQIDEFSTVTHVTPGPRPKISRDVDDDAMIAAAIAGRAEFLVTNDRDLLDIAAEK